MKMKSVSRALVVATCLGLPSAYAMSHEGSSGVSAERLVRQDSRLFQEAQNPYEESQVLPSQDESHVPLNQLGVRVAQLDQVVAAVKTESSQDVADPALAGCGTAATPIMVDDLGKKVDSLERRVNTRAASQSVGILRTDVRNLKLIIDDLDQVSKTLHGRLETVQAQVDTMKTQLLTVTQKLETELTTYVREHKTAQQELRKHCKVLEQKIADSAHHNEAVTELVHTHLGKGKKGAKTLIARVVELEKVWKAVEALEVRVKTLEEQNAEQDKRIAALERTNGEQATALAALGEQVRERSGVSRSDVERLITEKTRWFASWRKSSSPAAK